MERKRKGGAEMERIKRKKALATDAASCCKIPAMFASKGTGCHNVQDKRIRPADEARSYILSSSDKPEFVD
ncbi:hypothetical protein QQF64_019483 [Cirrhinus molitorella]|uniref:Uncharacterized protein n=1 Tax=Cirrhinus molitorella TaxID=172907 RepID=A0ABR3LFJ5_9TELE